MHVYSHQIFAGMQTSDNQSASESLLTLLNKKLCEKQKGYIIVCTRNDVLRVHRKNLVFERQLYTF